MFLTAHFRHSMKEQYIQTDLSDSGFKEHAVEKTLT